MGSSAPPPSPPDASGAPDGNPAEAPGRRALGRDWTIDVDVAARLARDASEPASDELAPDVVPGYRLGRRIAAGGAGAVYEAMQTSPRRAVALKVFHARRCDERQRRRIAHEAEILARLQHPSIAQVFAAHVGAVDTGDLAWIAMELVPGVAIDVWCRERGASLRRRVELIADVAEAVAHAHASGVIHRDLKPSNVLVTAAGVPKVVDFGVARMFGDAPAVGTLHTRDGDLIGTLAYMAAEQVEGAASCVDTRTDVHALGVLAYELLTGTLPRDPEWRTLPEWAQALHEPAPPLEAALAGAPADLSLIVATALDPDRDRRYATARALADDLRRFLCGEPVRARPPTSGYLLRSLVRRHRALVTGALATVVALTAGLVVSVRFALESDAQRRRADLESSEARREAYRAQIGVASEAIAAGNAPGARTALERAPESLRGLEWRYLSAHVDRAADVVRWAEPLARWTSVAPDGSLVAGGSTGGGAIVLEARTGAVRLRVPASPEVERGALLGDGRLVVARAGGGLDVIDVATGATRTLGAVASRTGPCDALCTSATGARVCESRHLGPRRLRIVDLDDGTERLREADDDGSWTSLAFDATARSLVAAGGDGRVLLVDATSDAPVRALYQHVGIAFAAAIDPAARRVASGGSDRRALVFDLREGGSTAPDLLALHQQDVRCATWSDDGTLLATWSGERVVRIFHAADRRLVRTIAAPDVDEACVRLRFARDGACVEGFDSSSRHVWFTTDDSELDVLRGHRTNTDGNRYPYLYAVAFSPDGRRVATAGWDGDVRVWSVETCRTLAVLATPGPVHAIAFSPDGARIVAAGRPHHVTSFDARTGRRIAVADDGTNEMHGGVAYTSDGASLLSTDYPRGCVERDPDTLARRSPIAAAIGAGFSLAAGAHDGVVVGYHDGRWDRVAAGGASGRTPLPPAGGGMAHVALSADGAWLAAASEDGTARMCDARTGALAFVVRGHVGRVYAVAFSPDGRRLATGGDDGTVRLHDTATGEELLVLRGHSSYVYDLAFSPDGTMIASVSGDNTARLWSARTLVERVARRDAALAAEAAVEPVVREELARHADPAEVLEGLRSRRVFDDAHRAAASDVALRLLCARGERITGR